MHIWNDDWFQKNGNDLYDAINYIEKNLRKYGIIICGKEKYGCYRDDYLTFWDGSLHQMIYHRTFCREDKKLEKIIYFLDYCFLPYCKTNYGWTKTGFCSFPLRKLFCKLVNRYQAKMYNKVFQKACLIWPNVIDELIAEIDGYDMIKPCKYGIIDGTKIHNKYWKTIHR